jgi:hypothetical protein
MRERGFLEISRPRETLGVQPSLHLEDQKLPVGKHQLAVDLARIEWLSLDDIIHAVIRCEPDYGTSTIRAGSLGRSNAVDAD